MSVRTTFSALAATALAATALAAAPVPTTTDVSADPDPGRWADAEEATIYPSVYMTTNGAGCTSNFVFEQFTEITDEAGNVVDVERDVYLGYAAHCAGLGTNTDTDGCATGSEPIGTTVQIDGASNPGTLAYSSWATMVERGETPGSDVCSYNDFALVEIDDADHDKVNPSVPFFGGPTGVGGATAVGDDVYSVGNSGLRAGIQQLGPKVEASLGMFYSDWQHLLYAVTPGIPGDSGSGHMNADGAAIGVSSTLYAAPFAGANGVTDLQRSLDYLTAHTGLEPILAEGTEPFSALLP